jgi:hypothetical protein
MSADEFRAFSLDSALRMYTDVNPDFFDGTTFEGGGPRGRGRSRRDPPVRTAPR